MTGNDGRSEKWKPCPPGTLANIAGAMRRERRRRWAVQVVSAALGILLAAVFIYWFERPPNDPGPTEFHYGGISCTEVRQQMQQYMMGQASPEVREKIRAHLAECKPCQELLRQMGHTVSAVSPHGHSADCPCCRHRQVGALQIQPQFVQRPPVQPALTLTSATPRNLVARID